MKFVGVSEEYELSEFEGFYCYSIPASELIA
jgi:hypothetical protein